MEMLCFPPSAPSRFPKALGLSAVKKFEARGRPSEFETQTEN